MARYPEMDAYLEALGIDVHPPKGRQGCRTGTSSLHDVTKQCRARDWGQSDHGHAKLVQICEALEPHARGGAIEELFYTAPDGRRWYYDRGKRFTPSPGLENDHRDHVHAGLWVNRYLPVPQKPEPEEDLWLLLMTT